MTAAAADRRVRSPLTPVNTAEHCAHRRRVRTDSAVTTADAHRTIVPGMDRAVTPPTESRSLHRAHRSRAHYRASEPCKQRLIDSRRRAGRLRGHQIQFAARFTALEAMHHSAPGPDLRRRRRRSGNFRSYRARMAFIVSRVVPPAVECCRR